MLKECQRTICFLSSPLRNIDKTHLPKIIFSMFLSYLLLESKRVENNIFEGMTSICLNIISKQFKHDLNLQHIFYLF